MAESLNWISTRGSKIPTTIRQTIAGSLATDGGLYIPSFFPQASQFDLLGIESFPEIASRVLSPYFDSDAIKDQLPEICKEAFHFPLTLKKLDSQTRILELFHGPTAAFKDFGARFLAQCMKRIQKQVTILVATSGDTGGAVASAFHRLDGFRVVILFPKDRISPRQKHQLTAWGDNVLSLEVDGDFDSCQNLVKSCFADTPFSTKLNLSSANSINVGRLLPQMAYYACASLWSVRQMGHPLNLIIPSGNLGNAVGAMWAQQMGFPVGQIVIATNANETLKSYYDTGAYQSRGSIATLANAMDVGNPSNFERLKQIYPNVDRLRKQGVQIFKVSDSEIQSAIKEAYLKWNEVLCPHTATAAWIKLKQGFSQPVTLVATAHASKFDTVVEPVLQGLLPGPIPLPQQLVEILSRKPVFEAIPNDLNILKKRLGSFCP